MRGVTNLISIPSFQLLLCAAALLHATSGTPVALPAVHPYYGGCGPHSHVGQRCATCQDLTADGCSCNDRGQCAPFCSVAAHGATCHACSTNATGGGCACDRTSGACLAFCALLPSGHPCNGCRSKSGAGCVCSRGQCTDRCQVAFDPLMAPKCDSCHEPGGPDGCVCSSQPGGGACVPFCEQASPYKLPCKGCPSGECQCSAGKCLDICQVAGNQGAACRTCKGKKKGGTCVCSAGRCVPDSTCSRKGTRSGAGCTTCAAFATDGACACVKGRCAPFCSSAANQGRPCRSCGDSLAALYGECQCHARACVATCALPGAAGRSCESCDSGPDADTCRCQGGRCRHLCALKGSEGKKCQTCTEADSDGCLCHSGACANFCTAPSSNGKACRSCPGGAVQCVCRNDTCSSF